MRAASRRPEHFCPLGSYATGWAFQGRLLLAWSHSGVRLTMPCSCILGRPSLQPCDDFGFVKVDDFGFVEVDVGSTSFIEYILAEY